MTYASFIGKRYLYGSGDRAMARSSIVSLAVAVVLSLLLLNDIGGQTTAIMVFIASASAIVTALLALFTVFTSVAMLGVVFGVAALTTVMAVTTGFEQQFRDKVLGVNAHVIVQRPDFVDYEQVERIARNIDPQVVGVQPFVFTEMLVTNGRGKISGVAIKGIDPARAAETLDLDRHMVKGKVADLAAGEKPAAPGVAAPIIIGQELAKKLGVEVGSDIRVVIPVAASELEASNLRVPTPRTRSYRVAGIFYSGFEEYDKRLMYVGLHEGQALLARGNLVTGVELKVRDVDEAKRVGDKLRRALRELDRGFDFDVKDWFELNRPLFKAVRTQKIVMMIVMTVIVIVAAFNMIAALATMVTQKSREVSMLKSMGATDRRIGDVFLIVGSAIGVIGTTLGVGLGLLTSWLISSFGFRLDPAVYMIDRLPIRVIPMEVLLVAGITMIISWLATLLPSLRAARMQPVDGLRYD
ncbi:MAG: ABC transporter permease [Myxococcales bacterium]|nr:ABC transporter permease [Myxococcales bacterium]